MISLPCLVVVSAAALAGCASDAGSVAAQMAAVVNNAVASAPASASTTAVTPAPFWAGNVVAAMAMLYPPAQSRLYVVKAPAGLTDVLRTAGYSVVEGKAAKDETPAGYRLSVQTRALGGGSIVVVAHVGQQTLSRIFADGQAASGWSLDLTGAPDALKARVALIQNPPRRIVLPQLKANTP